MDARFTAGRLTHREARLCHQVMPPGGPDTPSVTPPLPRGPDVMRPPMGPPGPMMSARVGGAADAQQQLLASNFLRESQDFMARFNDIQRRFAGRPDLMQVEMQQAIQGANRELLMRHQQSGGNYPMFVIQPTAQGLVAFMQTPRGPMPIPLGGPPMPPGMSVGGAVPGMPGVPGSMPGMPPGMMMTPGGMMRPSMIPGRPGMMEYPPQPVGPDTIAFVRGLYLSRNPERMTPQMRTLWQQTIIGGLELLGFVSPSSLEAVIGVPPREPLTISGSRMQPLFRVIGAVRLIGVAIAFDRLRSGRTGPGDIPPVDVGAAIDAVNRDPNRLVNVGIARGPDNRITSVNITPRPQTELPTGRTALTTAQVADRLRAQGMSDAGPNAQFRIEGGSIVLTNPTPEGMQALMRALQTMATVDVVPVAASEKRLAEYQANTRRKVNVARQPAPPAALNRYELNPRTDIPGGDRVTFEALQQAMLDAGVPAAGMSRDGSLLTISRDGINATNLMLVANVLERLMLPATPDSRMDDYGRNANRKVNVARLPATGATTSFELTPRTDGIPEIERLGTEAISKALRDAGVPAAGMTVDATKVTVSGVAITPENLAKVATALETLVRGPVAPPSAPERGAVERLRVNANNGVMYLVASHNAVVNVDTGAPPAGAGVVNVGPIVRNPALFDTVTTGLPPAAVTALRTKLNDPSSWDVKVTESGQTLDFRYKQGKWEFKATGAVWKNVTETVAAPDVGASAPIALHFNNNVLPTLRDLGTTAPDAMRQRIENVNRSLNGGMNYLMTGHGALVEVDFAAPVGRKDVTNVLKNPSAANVALFVAGPPPVPPASLSAVMQKLFDPNAHEIKVTESGQTIEMRFRTGKWEFKATGAVWKNVTEAVLPADVGASAPVALHFNTNMMPTLRELDGASPAAAQARLENLQKSQESGVQYVKDIHGAADVAPATTPPSYRITESGKTLDFRSNRGKWEFKAAGGTWKNVTEAVVDADVGASAPVALHFNTNVLPTLRELDGASPAVAQGRIENLQKSQQRGLQYMRGIHGAEEVAPATTPPSYRITESGKTLDFRSNRGKWEFKAAGGTWKNVTEAVVDADVGASAPVALHFNTNVLPTLRELDGASPAAAQTRIETLDKNRQDGVDYIRLRHEGTEVAPATVPPSYRITESGQALDFRYNRGKWEFKAAGGTWKNVTEAVVDADVGASGPIATHFNTNVLVTLRAFNTPS